MKWVVYNELGEDKLVRVTVEEAIRQAKEAHPEYEYTDGQALSDFVIVHWAWIEEEKK